ncbi:COX15/CtaA family protein [Amantichitinum ursilacus]|uniref:Heme A synthase n=1 Tax=Amantichitinum ursilacus TaxID=857265 RepID=A0A0N1JRK0_9NEIS|nr:COX15/CtaA family protein [Amantichitinum ursilacus]KPC49309.1 Heme A synthase [Amantichitinum ursilacus]
MLSASPAVSPRVRLLLWVAVVWTFCLLMLGAWVRLHDAGLGCPDWPGCYGHLTVPEAPHEIAKASAQFGGTVEPAKGWKEMIHRYAAGGLGLLVLALTVALLRKRTPHSAPVWLVLAPPLVILLQALLGMWTVTLKLMPVVVTAHLMGGMSMLALLTALAARSTLAPMALPAETRSVAWLALALVAVQIVLGGWVSTNYAGLACDGFPACRGSFAPAPGLLDALRPDRALGLTADGNPLTIDHLAAIHWLHRCGALLVTLLVLALVLRLWRDARPFALALLAALVLQVALGVANVELSLPLPLAVAHNGGAALLLLTLITLLARLRRPKEIHGYANAGRAFALR